MFCPKGIIRHYYKEPANYTNRPARRNRYTKQGYIMNIFILAHKKSVINTIGFLKLFAEKVLIFYITGRYGFYSEKENVVFYQNKNCYKCSSVYIFHHKKRNKQKYRYGNKYRPLCFKCHGTVFFKAFQIVFVKLCAFEPVVKSFASFGKAY